MFLKVLILYVYVSVCQSLSYNNQENYLSSGTQGLFGSYPYLGYSPGNYLGNGLLGNKYTQLGFDRLPQSNYGNHFNTGIYPGSLGGYNTGILGTNGLTSGLLGANGLSTGLLGANGLSTGLLGATGYNYLNQLPYNGLNYPNVGSSFSSLPNFGRTSIDGSISGILREYRQDPLDGSYAFGFESGNGIRRQESGTATGPTGAVIKRGSYSFTHPDGTPADYDYIADEHGFRIKSNLLPGLPGQAGIFGNDQFDGAEFPLLRTAFLNSHRQDSLPLPLTGLSGRANNIDDLDSRTHRSSTLFGRGRGPFTRLRGGTFDEGDPFNNESSSLSSHAKRENKSQDFVSTNQKRGSNSAPKSST